MADQTVDDMSGAGIKGVLFDKDGTLLDYFATWLPANRIAAMALAEGDEALCERLLAAGGTEAGGDSVRPGTVLAMGNYHDIAVVWAEHLPGRKPADLVPIIDRVFTEAIEDSAVAVVELAPLLHSLKSRGLILGVATSDSDHGARVSLGRVGAIDLFDFVAGYDSGHGVKPGPGMVRGFCAAVALQASEVAVVGDNLHDLEMGHRAGAGLIVGVLSGTAGREDLAPRAHYVLDSIVQLEALLDSL